MEAIWRVLDGEVGIFMRTRHQGGGGWLENTPVRRDFHRAVCRCVKFGEIGRVGWRCGGELMAKIFGTRRSLPDSRRLGFIV